MVMEHSTTATNGRDPLLGVVVSDNVDSSVNGELTQSEKGLNTPSTMVTTPGSSTANRSVPQVMFEFPLPSRHSNLPQVVIENVPPGSMHSSGRMLSQSSKNPSGVTIDSVASQQQTNTSVGSVKRKKREHKDSMAEREYHKTIQNEHKKTRIRHYTDPVDFDGILRIIGGCNKWQFWVYFLVSLQQIPHAMFNLSIVFMLFAPDHRCYIQKLDSQTQKCHNRMADLMSKNLPVNFDCDYESLIREISLPLYPKADQMSVGKMTRANWNPDHSSRCEYFARSDYDHFNLADLREKTKNNPNFTIPVFNTTGFDRETCSNWTYDTSMMTSTIVTQWSLYCSKYLRRADAQLAYAIGYMAGCFLCGISSDRFGRKPTIIGFGVLASMFGLILPYSTYFEVFLFVRFLSALCNEAADLAAYILCMEITGIKNRAVVGSLMQAPWALGYCILALLAYLTKDWRTLQIITSALHTVSVLLICVLPESPRWLIVNNRVREAETIIRRACRMNNRALPENLELIKHAEKRQWVKRHERANAIHVFKSSELIVRSVIVHIIWVVTALTYYGVTLNLSDQSGPGSMFRGNIFINNAIAGAIEIPVLVLCVFLLATGRRKSQMACLILAGVMMLGVVLSPGGVTGDNAPWLPLLFMYLGKAAAQAAFNILYIFTSELYPTVIRNQMVGICSMIGRLGSGVAGYVAMLSDITLPIVPMIIFGVFSFVAGTLVIFLPETLNQPLPDTLQDAVLLLKPDQFLAGFGGQHGLCDDQHLISMAQAIEQEQTTTTTTNDKEPDQNLMVANNDPTTAAEISPTAPTLSI